MNENNTGPTLRERWTEQTHELAIEGAADHTDQVTDRILRPEVLRVVYLRTEQGWKVRNISLMGWRVRKSGEVSSGQYIEDHALLLRSDGSPTAYQKQHEDHIPAWAHEWAQAHLPTLGEEVTR